MSILGTSQMKFRSQDEAVGYVNGRTTTQLNGKTYWIGKPTQMGVDWSVTLYMSESVYRHYEETNDSTS